MKLIINKVLKLWISQINKYNLYNFNW